MPAPIAYWRREHAAFASLLTVLEHKLAALGTDEAPDYGLMLDIVGYLRNFPDRYHHPREDIAFALLEGHDRAMGPMLERLRGEHGSIAAAGEKLHGLLAAAAGDAIVPRDDLESAAREYLAAYRNHIAREELNVLPRAGTLLTLEDWAEVARAVPARADPLFGDAADERYREMRRQMAIEST